MVKVCEVATRADNHSLDRFHRAMHIRRRINSWSRYGDLLSGPSTWQGDYIARDHQVLAGKEVLDSTKVGVGKCAYVCHLVTNAKRALTELPKPQIYGWLDSTVALHWILGNGQYKQFMANCVRKICKYAEIQWRYVPTDQNPADMARHGGEIISGT